MSRQSFRSRWEQAIREAGLGLTDTGVALALATWGNPDGTSIKVGMDRLAREGGFGVSTAERAAARLTTAGWFVTVERPRGTIKATHRRLAIPESTGVSDGYSPSEVPASVVEVPASATEVPASAVKVPASATGNQDQIPGSLPGSDTRDLEDLRRQDAGQERIATGRELAELYRQKGELEEQMRRLPPGSSREVARIQAELRPICEVIRRSEEWLAAEASKAPSFAD